MRQLIGFMVGTLLSFSVFAASTVSIYDSWIRATAPGEDSAALHIGAILSRRAATLIGVSSPVAGSAEIHSMTHENGEMKMQVAQPASMAAGRALNFEGAGYHVMLLNLKHPLKEGEHVPFTLTLVFPDKSTADVTSGAIVKALTATGHEIKPGMSGM